MASIRDRRERMANQLLMRGHASVDEILEASFGEWPPKGLDITGKNDQSVQIVDLLPPAKDGSFFKRLKTHINEQLHYMGRTTMDGERLIEINRLLCCTLPGLFGRSHLSLTLGHESIHILQGDHYHRAETLFGRDAALTIRRNQSSFTSNLIARDFTRLHPPEKKGWLKQVFQWPNLPSVLYLDYLKKGNEMQARIHEVMQTGYPYWKRLPQNFEELTVALHDAGVKTSKAVIKDLEKSPTFAATCAVFATGKIPGTSATEDLNQIRLTVNDAGKVYFTQHTLPRLYADLIEMYGDRPGRSRFGYGPNINHFLRTNNPESPQTGPL